MRNEGCGYNLRLGYPSGKYVQSCLPHQGKSPFFCLKGLCCWSISIETGMDDC